MRKAIFVAKVVLLALLFHSAISSDVDMTVTSFESIKCEEDKKTQCMTLNSKRADKFLRPIKRKIPRAYV